jgi:hypothetical protein
MFKFSFFKKKVVENEAAIIAEWEKSGKPVPPPHAVKRRAIEAYRVQYNPEVVIETGTYMGDMVEMCRHTFKKVYSIELSEKLYKRAKKRFKNMPEVELLCGDSGFKLPEILSKVNQPCLFWLDGHYSGGITAKADLECPVREELQAILNHPYNHVVLIDDARLFNGTHDYPTIEEIENIIATAGKPYSVTVKEDIIRLTC